MQAKWLIPHPSLAGRFPIIASLKSSVAEEWAWFIKRRT